MPFAPTLALAAELEFSMRPSFFATRPPATAPVVHKHIGRQLRRLLAENAAPARARRTEVIRWILVFARLGSAWVIKDGDRSSAVRIVDVTTGIENDRALSRAGVVGAQNEIT